MLHYIVQFSNMYKSLRRFALLLRINSLNLERNLPFVAGASTLLSICRILSGSGFTHSVVFLLSCFPAVETNYTYGSCVAAAGSRPASTLCCDVAVLRVTSPTSAATHCSPSHSFPLYSPLLCYLVSCFCLDSTVYPTVLSVYFPSPA